MKHTLIALALAAASFTAQAVEWVHVTTSDQGVQTYMDRDVYRAYGKAGALLQRTVEGRVLRSFVTVTLQECKQGFGVLVLSDIDGRNQTRGGTFVVGSGSVGDAMGEYLCNATPAHVGKGGTL